MKVEEVKKSEQIDKLRRRLLRLGAYVAPTVTIISLSYSRAQAQACTPDCNPNQPCTPDLAPPIFRKKKFDEGEDGLDSLWEEDPYSSESRKSPWYLRTPFKNSIMKDRFRRRPFKKLPGKKLPGLEPEEKEE